MTFAPILTDSWWVLAALILIGTAYLGWPAVSAVYNEWTSLVREVDLVSIVSTVALSIVLSLVAVFVLLRAVLVLARFISIRVLSQRERRAASWYGGSWLALWHLHDEPMSALAATITRAPRMLPRISIKWPISVFLKPYNDFIAPSIDEIAWPIVMGKIQGADIFGLNLTSVSCMPSPFLRAWPPLPRSVLHSLSRVADTGGYTVLRQTCRRIRWLARGLSATDAALHLVTPVDWKAVLHTLYFDNSSIRYLIAQHIGTTSNGAVTPSSELVPRECRQLDQWREKQPPNRGPKMTRVTPTKLQSAVLKVAAISLIGLLVSIATKGLFDSNIRPYLFETQIGAMATRSTQPDFMNLKRVPTESEINARHPSVDGTVVGDLLAKFVILRAITPTAELLDSIQPPDIRNREIQRIMYALGVEGRAQEAEQLIASLGGDEDYEIEGIMGLQLLAGLIRGSHRPSEAFFTKVVSALTPSEGRGSVVLSAEANLAVPVFAALNRFEAMPRRLIDYFSFLGNKKCEKSVEAAETAVIIGNATAVERALSFCQDVQLRKQMRRRLIPKVRPGDEVKLVKILISPDDEISDQLISPLLRIALASGDASLLTKVTSYFAANWQRLAKNEPSILSIAQIEEIRRTKQSQSIDSIIESLVSQAKIDMDGKYRREGIEETLRYSQLLKIAGRKTDLANFSKELGDTAHVKDGTAGRCPNVHGLLRIAVVRLIKDGREAAMPFVLRALDPALWTLSECKWPTNYLELIQRYFLPIPTAVMYPVLKAARLEPLSTRYGDERRSKALIVARFFTQINAAYQARQTALMIGDPAGIVEGFSSIMDVWIEERSPGMLQRHGLDRGDHRPSAITIRNVSPLP